MPASRQLTEDGNASLSHSEYENRNLTVPSYRSRSLERRKISQREFFANFYRKLILSMMRWLESPQTVKKTVFVSKLRLFKREAFSYMVPKRFIGNFAHIRWHIASAVKNGSSRSRSSKIPCFRSAPKLRPGPGM